MIFIHVTNPSSHLLPPEGRHCLGLIPSIMDLNFDSSLRGISGHMESLDSLFQSKTVGDKWFQVNKPTRDESNCFRVLYEGIFLKISKGFPKGA